MNGETNPTLRTLFTGLLLMTAPGIPLLAASDPEGGLLITDFTSSGSDLGWYVVNDNVMGGRSEGDFDQEQGTLRFRGHTNTDGGGFSSIRTKPVQLDLSEHAGIRLRVEGDGRRYTWRLTSAARWRDREVSYWADFETVNGAWTTVDVPFSSFVPKFRGYQLDGPALDVRQITGMGLMIYDKQDGPFELRLASVSAYAKDAHFALAQYQWRKRVLVLSAPTKEDENFLQQKIDLASTTGAFADREMTLVTLLDDSASTAGDRELTAEQAAAAREALGIRAGTFALRLIGKDGSVKLSGDKATPMTEIYALIDTMPMRRREASERQEPGR